MNLGMGEHTGNLDYRVQALKVIIDAMLFILLVLILLLHLYEHHAMQRVLSELFKIMRTWSTTTNTHEYGS